MISYDDYTFFDFISTRELNDWRARNPKAKIISIETRNSCYRVWYKRVTMNKIEETAMLFDWFSDRGEPFQVQGIDVDNGGRHHLCSSVYGWNNNQDVAPIPLTEKIMEVNGFEKWVNEPQVCYMLPNLPDVVFSINDENESNTCSITTLVDYNGIMHVLITVTYVNELQRALRQCGLNEFANHLKIQ